MKPEEIKLNDWMRILVGQVPPEFYLELIIRAILVYALLTVSMRLLGKRMAAQVSRLEMAALVALASAIGVPMLAADRGILPAFIIAAVVVLITRAISYISVKNQQFEQVTQGDIDILVENGVMKMDILRKVRITRERLFAHLRSENIMNLGTVLRMYMEANGAFTTIKSKEPKPGLMVLPDWDKEFTEQKVKPTGTVICNNCGAEKPEQRNGASNKCVNCGADDWTKAVTDS